LFSSALMMMNLQLSAVDQRYPTFLYLVPIDTGSPLI
jgi:hypothetical protein